MNMNNAPECVDSMNRTGTGPGTDLNRRLYYYKCYSCCQKKNSLGISTLPSNQTNRVKRMNVVNPTKAWVHFQN